VENVYQLKWKRTIRTQLRSLPGRIRKETVQAILNLREEPFPPDAEELRDHYKGIWKIKIGDNNHLLCLDGEGDPQEVSFVAGYVTDPNEDLNPATRVEVQTSDQ
jgi:hypothetical protein